MSLSFQLDEKVALVTGASRGLGAVDEVHMQPHDLQALGRSWTLSSSLTRRRPGVDI